MSPVECATKEATAHSLVLDFYGLREEPFGVTPNPRYLYLSPRHREALASLLYAVETKRGFSALVAEPGTGKTTLLFYLLEKMKRSARTVFLFRPDNNAHELLQSVLTDLGIKVQGKTVPEMHEILNIVLLEELRAGRHFVWVIDEAHDLDSEVLETVRLLSNFETATSKLMHIVLAGQPALAEKLERPELLQLRQRVSTFIHLGALTAAETSHYIDHRLQLAGYKGPKLFLPETREMIVSASQGIPRNINTLCFLCLSLGFVERARQIGPEILQQVLADYGNRETEDEASPQTTPRIWLQENIDAPVVTGLEQSRARSSHWWMGFAIFFVIPLAFFVLQSGPDALESPVAQNIVTKISGYDYHMPTVPPMVAPALRPPKPPENLADLVAEQPTTDGVVQETVEAEPTKREIAKATPAGLDMPRKAMPTGLRVVYAGRDETLFQIALEYYGKANWVVVAKIRSQNPDIRDSFTTIKAGQRVVLPDLAPEYPWKVRDKSASRYSSPHF